jgi:predicted nucleic acid-binding protein
MRFVDTNVAVYAVLTDPVDERKQRISEALLAREAGDLAVSIQVLGEFYTQLTRPSRSYSLGHLEALAAMEGLLRYHVQPLTLETFSVAMQYRERFGLNYWDCLILAAAKLSGCDAVYSEDMSASQDYDGIRVINPFEVVGESTPI